MEIALNELYYTNEICVTKAKRILRRVLKDIAYYCVKSSEAAPRSFPGKQTRER
jgi:hypothetical protein